MKTIQNQIFWITLAFFFLGMIHISLALVGLLCFVIPFVQYAKYKDKVWCKYYCPRAGYFTLFLSKVSLGLELPKILKDKRLKKWVVGYFILNIFFATLSTIMVSFGRMEAMAHVRFMMAFGLPPVLPQLLSFEVMPGLLHFSYRVYSMMFTSVIVGTVLGILYRPRTWCGICPVNTLTTSKK